MSLVWTEFMFQRMQNRITQYRTELLLFFLAALARFGYWILSGTTHGGDFGAYSAACNIWFTNPVGIITAHKGIVYAGFTLPFCSVYSLPFTTIETWIILQMLVSALGVVLVYRTGTLLINWNAGLVAGLALAVLWDTFQWTTVLYSDAMFTFAMILCLWTFARYREYGTTRARAEPLLALGFFAVTRPFGFPIVIGWIVYEVWPSNEFVDAQIFARNWIPIGSLALIVLSIPLIIKRRNLVEKWSRGWIVVNDATYTYALPSPNEGSLLGLIIANHVHVLVLAAAKVVMFFAPFVPRHSTFHILVNIVTYVPIVGVGLVGAYLVWRNRPDLFRYLVTPILVTLAITALTFVSCDFRYRAPLGPVFALLAGYAVVYGLDSYDVKKTVSLPN